MKYSEYIKKKIFDYDLLPGISCLKLLIPSRRIYFNSLGTLINYLNKHNKNYLYFNSTDLNCIFLKIYDYDEEVIDILNLINIENKEFKIYDTIDIKFRIYKTKVTTAFVDDLYVSNIIIDCTYNNEETYFELKIPIYTDINGISKDFMKMKYENLLRRLFDDYI